MKDFFNNLVIEQRLKKRDLHSAIEFAYGANDTDQIEKLRLLYGDNISLLEFLLGKVNQLSEDSDQLFPTRITILMIGVSNKADSNRVIKVRTAALIENYLEILLWLKDKSSFEDLNSTAINALVDFTVKLKYIGQLSQAVSDRVKAFVTNHHLQNIISDILIAYQSYVHEKTEDSIPDIDYLFCKKNITMLKVHSHLQTYQLFTIESAIAFLDNYIINLGTDLNENKQSLTESNAEICILYYHLYCNRQNFSLDIPYSVVIQQIETYLTDYFDLFTGKVLSGRTRNTEIAIGNYCYKLSEIYFESSCGHLGLYFDLMGDFYFGNYEKAMDKIKNDVGTSANFKLPMYLKEESYSMSELIFVIYLKQMEYLDTIGFNLERLIKEIDDAMDNNYLREELFEFLLSIFDADRSLFNLQKPFHSIPIQSQCQVLFHMLHTDKVQLIKNLKNWENGENLRFIKSQENFFSQDVIDSFVNFYQLFADESTIAYDNSKIFSSILSIHWKYLADMQDKELIDQGMSKNYIKKMGRITIPLSAVEGLGYEGFYHFIQIWSKNQAIFRGRGNKGFNKKNFYRICRKIKRDIENKYWDMSLYHWKLSERNIIDEINIILDKS